MAVHRKRILELHDFGEGMSIHQIHNALGNSRNTIAKVIEQANTAGITKERLGEIDEKQLAELLASKKPSTSYAQPDCEYIHKELDSNAHITLKLLWSEYLTDCRQASQNPCQYAQYCSIYRKWAKSAHVTRRITHRPGYAVQTDWAGMRSEVVDRVTGEVVKAHYFVAVLPYSPYLYVEAFPDEKEHSWISAHIHMYRFLGGVPAITVCDNLRTGVKKPDRYEPKLNDTYARMAEHYDTTIIPTRVYHPKGKASVERTVKTVETWVIAALRKRTFFSFSDLNEAVMECVCELNGKKAPDSERTRYDIFTEDEYPQLKALPFEDYRITRHHTATLQHDAHFQFERMRYSAPCVHIGKRLDLFVSETTIAVYHENSHICSHRRLTGRLGQYSTIETHMPEHLRNADILWSESGFRRWAKKAGPSVYGVVDAILKAHPIVEQSYRSCRGLMSLAQKRGTHILEEACSRALAVSMQPSYTQIKNILATIEDEPVSTSDSEKPSGGTIGDTGFLRDPSEYQTGGADDERAGQ
jgi:transposase